MLQGYIYLVLNLLKIFHAKWTQIFTQNISVIWERGPVSKSNSVNSKSNYLAPSTFVNSEEIQLWSSASDIPGN
jgi:hypothetical protein